MPWKACSAMEKRLRFVARLLEGEAMTDVCREFGISATWASEEGLDRIAAIYAIDERPPTKLPLAR